MGRKRSYITTKINFIYGGSADSALWGWGVQI